MSKAILLRGIPGCGKSTWSTKFIYENAGWVRVNRDDIRGQLYGESYKHTSSAEKKVLTERNRQIEEALKANLNVIVDETFCNINTSRKMEDFFKERNTPFEYKTFTDVTLEQCIARDALRTGRAHVGERVIRIMNKNLKELLIMEAQNKVIPFNDKLSNCIIFDMDGTLSLITNRGPFDTHKALYDKPNKPVVDILKRYINELSVSIFIVTGREEKYKSITESWLNNNLIIYDKLYMRETGDKRPDIIIKKEIYEKHIKNNYNVLFVMEDRSRVVNMYREIGLTVFQVSEGNY